MPAWQFRKGLEDLGNGCFAYIQPDGTWGWSNAGLVESQGQTLLVDTLLGLDLTTDMLAEMRRAVPAAATIQKLVNTHGNADHIMGNQLVEGAEIIASPGTAAEIAEFDPELLANFKDNWREFGELGVFYHNTMGRFNYDGIEVTAPNRLFEGELGLQIGDKQVQLVDVGPAHTEGDTLVYVPEDKVVYTGDILFHLGHPIVWAGPVSGWIAACDYILGLDVETVVPGHGPLADKQAVSNLKSYFEYVSLEARRRYDAGMDYEEAARDIALDAFGDWTDAERIVVNVYNLYREFGAELPEAGAIEMFDAMARYRAHVDCCNPP